MSNANVFTDEFRAALPTSVKDFLTHHEIKLCFKHEVNPLSDGSKGKTYNNLIKSLGSLCNPIVDNDVVTDQNENDVCYKHYFKQLTVEINIIIKHCGVKEVTLKKTGEQ